MKRPHQVAALILILLSAFVAYKSFNLQYYTPLGPGPGFFPLWISFFIAGLSLVMMVQATFKKSEPLPQDFFDSKRAYLRVLAICAAWVFATLSLKTLGYQLTMMVFFPVLLLSMGSVKWYTILIVTFLGSFGAYWFFSHLLRIPLPVGPFDELVRAMVSS